MKNAINYYYNLNPEKIVQKNNEYKFIYDESFYTLIDITDNYKNLNELYNISVELNNKGIYTHQFIFNIKNNIETYINDKIYVLLKSYGEMNQLITLEDIVKFSNMTNFKYNSKIKKNNWYYLWMEKMDYFEYQISQLSKKFPILTESFNYFEGIVETGISILSLEKNDDSVFSVCHNRICKKNTLFDLYNPLNFIIDVRVRDVSEFIKETVPINEVNDILETYLNNNALTNLEYKLFFVRFLYPTFYFDIYEKIINNQIEESEIISCLDNINNYENLIKLVYEKINSISILPEIEWIKKM